jgi:tRNA dimethylallyltransferase
LYVRALLRGLDPAPPANPAFRHELAGLAAKAGRAALHARLAAVEPGLAERLHPNDQVRVIRALEMIQAGSAVGAARARWRETEPLYDVRYFGLTLDRETLAGRLRARATAMIETGLEAEVQRLLAHGYSPTLPALQGIGYREFVQVIRGTLPRTEALRLMQRDTVRYAKRQWTWFQREPGIQWIDVEAAGGPAGVAAAIEARLQTGGGIE